MDNQQQSDRAGQPPDQHQAQQSGQQQSAPKKAQSEIGPTTYSEGGVVTQHGAGDAETQDAYRLGHPADGIAEQKRRAADQPSGQSGKAGAQSGQQQGQQHAGQQPNQSGQQGGTQRVEMLRDEGGHGAGQHVDLPSDQAQRLIHDGAARAV